MITIDDQSVARLSARYGAGFAKHLQALAGGRGYVSDREYVEVRKQYLGSVDMKSGRIGIGNSTKPRPPEPTIAELATNFAGAMSRWAADGFAVLDRAGYDARATVCDACEFWDGAARLGLGKCKAPGCGCTGMKRWLATEKCPLGKWL